MWNPFAKKKSRNELQSSADQVTDRVNELANQLQREGRIAELEAKLGEFERSALSNKELESWWHLYGITAFQAGNDSEALRRFKEAHELFPQSPSIAFSLGQQYIRAREIDLAFRLFSVSAFPHVSREFALAQARYAYLWNRYSEGRAFLRPFFEAYKQVRVLDDHFLYVRGLPFFGRSWSCLAAFSILSAENAELISLTNYVVQNCHDYDFDTLKQEQTAYLEDRPSVEIPILEARLAAVPNSSFPTGYTRLKLAIARARVSKSELDASRVVEAEVLAAQDFPWLEDIRTLALAEIAHRFGSNAQEQQLVETFLKKQPMLFEPDIALNFHLLRYQECLKPRVTSSDA